MMSATPENLQYTKEHEWVEERSGNLVRMGITDFAQSALGDIVYIQLPKVGDQLSAGAVCGEVESTKSVSEIYAPVTGKVVAVNSELDKAPELLNSDPYSAGWIAEVEISGASSELLSAAEYRTLTA
jgi:glycine cleavage system H protein